MSKTLLEARHQIRCDTCNEVAYLDLSLTHPRHTRFTVSFKDSPKVLRVSSVYPGRFPYDNGWKLCPGCAWWVETTDLLCFQCSKKYRVRPLERLVER